MFETERLFLRRMDKDDVGAIFALRKDAEIMRFIREPQTRREESENWVKLVSQQWDEAKIGFCLVIEKVSNKPIGWCGLWRLVETSEIEVGYAIARDHWGKGLATEAAEVVLHYGFTELQLEKIVAVARSENAGSRRVMQKLGMTYDYIGEFYGTDLVHYSITKEAWEKQRGMK